MTKRNTKTKTKTKDRIPPDLASYSTEQLKKWYDKIQDERAASLNKGAKKGAADFASFFLCDGVPEQKQIKTLIEQREAVETLAILQGHIQNTDILACHVRTAIDLLDTTLLEIGGPDAPSWIVRKLKDDFANLFVFLQAAREPKIQKCQAAAAALSATLYPQRDDLRPPAYLREV